VACGASVVDGEGTDDCVWVVDCRLDESWDACCFHEADVVVEFQESAVPVMRFGVAAPYLGLPAGCLAVALVVVGADTKPVLNGQGPHVFRVFGVASQVPTLELNIWVFIQHAVDERQLGFDIGATPPEREHDRLRHRYLLRF
jgi:hypothetical protein